MLNTTDKLAYRIKTLAKAADLSQRFIVKAISEGKLRAYKRDNATIIFVEDARAWLMEREVKRETAASSDAVN